MASRESDNGAVEPPVNDSIDELLDGLPAEPMLPKKRARPIDQAALASAANNRRADDKVIVSEGTDPRLRAQREVERERRASSTFGTSFLQPNLNWQKAVVGVVMMLAVLGIYAFVRQMKKKDAPPVAQNTQNTSSATPSAIAATATPVATEAIAVPPPQPTVEAKPLASTVAHHLPLRAHNAGDQHAPVTPAPTASANTRSDVARSL